MKQIRTSSYVTPEHLNRLSIPELSAIYARTEKPLPSGWVNGPTIRDCHILEYVHSGHGVVTINGKSFHAKAGEAFITFPHALVTLTADKTDPWGKTWLCLYGSKLPQLLEDLGISETSPVFSWDSCPELLEEMNRQIPILNKQNPTFEFDQAICANKLFKIIFTHQKRAVSAESAQREYVSRAIAFIERNLNKPLTVEVIAAEVGLNRTYFSGIFKRVTGMTAQEFLHRHKIGKACEFLLLPNSSVANVAQSVGYEPRTFDRVFRKLVGRSPSAYKKYGAD